MTDPYDAKYEDMQKYVPFIERVIEKLKVNNDCQVDSPRKAQLQKMEMLHDLLTNKQKKIKVETLIKCESVLIKLQTKIEKQATTLQSEDPILCDVKLKQQTPISVTCTKKDTRFEEDLLGPASPPPEIIVDDINQPVVIPTERRCSPILVKETKCSTEKLQQLKIDKLDRSKHQHDQKNICNIDCKPSSSKAATKKRKPSQDKNGSSRHNHSSFKCGTHDYNHGKGTQHQKHFKEHNINLCKERNDRGNKSTASEQKHQTVKVVITEPLPTKFKQQHFPSNSKFLSRSSTCLSNIKTLYQTSKTKPHNNDAYSPEESWEQFNESSILRRLGEKVVEDNPKSKTSGRYTPIPDVLKSPPLSVSDINNLLLESGSDKMLKDISEIGTRRPPKTEVSQKEPDKNSFEFVRKKLAQTARLNSPQGEKDKVKISVLPNERIALKYNPHPRQERLQSVSSTDSSECSTQSKTNSPSINAKLPMSISQRSPSQVASINVNVLPTINLSDPRLKRQLNPLSTTPEIKSLLPTPPTFSATQNAIYPNQNPIIYSRRKDPRISRMINNIPSAPVPTAPFRRMSTNQPQYSPEENWDTDGEKPVKSGGRYERSDSYERNNCDDRNMAPILNQTRLQTTGSETETSASKKCHQFNLNLKPAPQNEDNLCKTAKHKNNKNKLLPATTYVTPNMLKSDTEEDWDAEPAITNIKGRPLPSDATQSPINIPSAGPVVSPYQTQISPKAVVVSPKPPLHPTHMPHATHIPHIQQHYPSTTSHNSYRVQNPQPNNRFNSLLNDTSERMKYIEAKKQKSVEPRTYKEFREAKERALAQEAAMKNAAAAAEAKKRNELHTSGEKMQNEQKAKQKAEDYKQEKKHSHKDTKKVLTNESTLDKMYRTQNFNTSFPKANTSFKIPKKKTEDKNKDETTTSAQTKTLSNEKPAEKLKSNQTDTTTDIIKSDNQEPGKSQKEDSSKKCNKPHETGEKHLPPVSTNSSSEKAALQQSKPIIDTITDKIVCEIRLEKISDKEHDEKESKLESQIEPKEPLQEHLPENEITHEFNQVKARDPRCRPKTTPAPIATEVSNGAQQETLKPLGDIIITSSENQVILKPQQNLEKFNQITQQLSVKPQRILQRRNTMVVFDSAPLVDKEKLRKVNALLFEDVQAEEKRKHKQAEEERFIARRNKNLEDMFKKTDDNCTVSTQNIITGKRRTRATINFNETANARNIFNPSTNKDAIPSTAVSQVTKSPRSKFKIKIKNLARLDKPKEDDSDDDKPLNIIANKEAKLYLKPTESTDDETKSKTKTKKRTQLKECKTEEPETESKSSTSTKPGKKQISINRKHSINAENNEIKFTPIQNEDHQICAVSSTSTDNYNVEETTCSSTSTQKSCKKETDDNEPTSTASKSKNPTPTPTPELNEPILREIVDQILQPNSNREPILGILAQILSEEKLTLIKSLIESTNKQNADEQATKEVEEDTDKTKSYKQNTKNDNDIKEDPGDGEERKPITLPSRVSETKKATIPKKKRSELDRLNEDIRDMFICNGILTATGRRMCTIIGKDVASNSGKEPNKDPTLSPITKLDNANKKKSDLLKPPITSKTLRRSTRACKTPEDNEDNESVLSRTTDDSIDDSNSTTDCVGTDVTLLRKMPILKAHGPIKISDDVASSKPLKIKEANNKRKSDSKLDLKAKKIKINIDESKQQKNSESDEKNSDTDIDKAQVVKLDTVKNDIIIKNTNLNWHNQSKYISFCMICEKRIPATTSPAHYKTHHRENYISRMAPVILQQYKQGKLSKPLFGVKKSQKQPFWFSRCPFCLKYFNTALPLWLEHFQNHTVEFRYECSQCYRSSNKKLTISRHIKCCEGAIILTSAVKLNVPNVISAHVCHLCNFIQLRRDNLERHYIEQHQLDKKNVDLLGYTIKLFDVEDVECVTEEKAAQKEKEAWKSIEKNDQVIDIDDDDEKATATLNKMAPNNDSIVENVAESIEESQKETEDGNCNIFVNPLETQNDHSNEEKQDNNELMQNDNNIKAKVIKNTDIDLEKNTELTDKQPDQQEEAVSPSPATEKEQHFEPDKETVTNTMSPLFESQGSSDFEMIDQEVTAQNIQDELLTLAAKAAEKEEESSSHVFISNVCESVVETPPETHLTIQEYPKLISINIPSTEPQTKMSNIISSSIDMIYSKDANSSEPKNIIQAASNVFMPTRDENNYSPTIQILAQSIINIDEQENPSVTEKPITMAERLSQRFKDLQSGSAVTEIINETAASNENQFEIHIDDTSLGLTKEKDDGNKSSSNKSAQPSENVFGKLFNDTVLELEKDDLPANETLLTQQTDISNVAMDVPQTDSITVISDDEDWEDIEITETAPTVSSTASGTMQKTKSKGLFQKFGMFKGSSTKSKKHLSPMAFLPKKKAKDKSLSVTVLSHSPITTTATAPALTVSKPSEITNTVAGNSNMSNLSFKPVINIMDGLFPDSPCNDPIDLVPELAPLEPLQDLNDISSILDSNLSAININAADNHTSIEDALDFVSEQQANDKRTLSPSTLTTITPGQAKTTINNISHVGFSVQNSTDNCFKFYCLLQNCSFLYSSDSIGLEAHFMCEHSQIKWNGYCLMCQSQCLPTDVEYPITKEIHHMMEKHANNTAIDLNTESTQNSNSSSNEADGRPKIKIRRLTGDCLSSAMSENLFPNNDINPTSTSLTMLGALLVAQPKPPTIEMPPQSKIVLTEPLLIDKNTDAASQLSFKNANSDFLITSVTSADPAPPQTSLQISNVVSLNKSVVPPATGSEQIQIPKITNVRTLAPKADSLRSEQIENDRSELLVPAAETLAVSPLLKNVASPSTSQEITRSENDSPVLVAETVPIAQSKTGDFVVTQTLSAQYDEFSSTALGFNISIAASSVDDNTTTVSTPGCSNSASVASRQYKCMGSGCKFVSRVPVAMSDHLRFHERRNFSSKQDYLSCGFCFYSATDIDDYMKHANQLHIINKGINITNNTIQTSESDTASSLTKKIHNILNSKNGSSSQIRYSIQSRQLNQTKQEQDTQEVYVKKLRATIDEIVGPTGLADDKLYRCVVKNCQSHLTESTFLKHIMFHLTSMGSNPNNYLFKCPHCTAQYHRPAGIKAHIKNHARNRYFCYLCDETATNPGQILKHFSEKHWHTLNMYTKELLPQKALGDGPDSGIDSNYYVSYTQDLSAEEVRKFGEKLILEWQRKKSGSKTHFKSSEIDLLPLSAIFQRQLNCGECEYKTKVRTNMFRHLLMHKQNPDLANKSGASSVVDPVNPVPCLNSNERFFDKMTNLASSSLIPSSSTTPTTTTTATTTTTFKLPQAYVEESKRFVCGCSNCDYHAISDELFRTHVSTTHSSEMTYTCPLCKEEICKRGISFDRIMNHTRFHGSTIYRCEVCNYYHHLRYVVERHINDKHSTMKVNMVTHIRTIEDGVEGATILTPLVGKKYNAIEGNPASQVSNPTTRSTSNESSSTLKSTVTPNTNAKGKGKWECDVCGHKAATVGQIQTHCQQQHSVKSQYKCAHCNFGSQQLSQILHHIDDKHSGKSREAHTMYHKIFNNNEEVADTRPLWQRNDPTRVRHIRGILMEDEEESEEYRKKLALTEDGDDESNEDQHADAEENEDVNAKSYISGYEFGCYHCSFKTQTFEDLKERHYNQSHNFQLETAKPFWYRLHRRLCCPECRSFLGNYNELQQHLQTKHKKRFYAVDIKMAETDDTSQRLLCGYCTFHCANAEQLYKHHIKAQHWPQDIRIDNNEQIMEILALGRSEVSYQCTLCADIFSNQVAIVQHACNLHSGEDSFSYRELTNSLIYRCNSCCFTSTVEMELLRHAIDHYSRFKVCSFCHAQQLSFNACMQHCYAEHKNKIEKFRTFYPFTDIRKFLLQTLVIFPSGLVLNKRNLGNTQYGKQFVIDELYEEIYKISQQPPIPRLSIARLVARKSIEAQQKTGENLSSSSIQDHVFNAMLPRPKPISKRRCTVAFDRESDHHSINSNSTFKPKLNIIIEGEKSQVVLSNRMITNDHNQQHVQLPVKQEEFSAPLTANKISKRRRTVAVDRDTLFSSNLTSSSNSLLTELGNGRRKRKISFTHSQTSSPKHMKEILPLNLDIEPFSFYGKKPEILNLSKIYTKVAIGGIKTPLTLDKFKLLFNIDCQLKLTKCDEDRQLLAYNDYKHIKKACPASEKLKYN